MAATRDTAYPTELGRACMLQHAGGSSSDGGSGNTLSLQQRQAAAPPLQRQPPRLKGGMYSMHAICQPTSHRSQHLDRKGEMQCGGACCVMCVWRGMHDQSKAKFNPQTCAMPTSHPPKPNSNHPNFQWLLHDHKHTRFQGCTSASSATFAVDECRDGTLQPSLWQAGG